VEEDGAPPPGKPGRSGIAELLEEAGASEGKGGISWEKAQPVTAKKRMKTKNRFIIQKSPCPWIKSSQKSGLF
jgi:hypothetical protein